MTLNPLCGRVRATKHALRDPCYLRERHCGLVEIVERGAGVLRGRRGRGRGVRGRHEDESTLLAANNYAWNLEDLNRHKEAKALAHKSIPVARRSLGASHTTTIRLRWIYARSLYLNDGATRDDLREAVTTLEELERITRRVFGGAYPITVEIKDDLRDTRAVLRLDLRLNREDSV